jgi:hypothetical protein
LIVPLRRRLPNRSEDGQITAMLVIFSICLLIAIVAATDISASYLRRQSATSLADGAALAATEAAAAGGIYADSDDFVAIDETAARAAVDSYLSEVGAYGDYPGLTVAVDVVGHQVEVALMMPYRLPVRMPGVDTTTTIHATASAELPIT